MSNITLSNGKKRKNKTLKCQYKDCGKEFQGYPNTKYCPYHQNPKNREIIVKKEIYEKTTKEITHNFKSPTKVEVECSIPECDEKYNIILYPEQKEYPKYCKKHRNQHKRNLFLNKMRG